MSTVILLEATNDALERLLRNFWAERFLYLAAAVSSFVALAIMVVQAMRGGPVAPEYMAAIFASGGIVSIGCFRIAYFFKRGFDLIDVIVRQAAALNTQPAAPASPTSAPEGQ